MRYDTIIIGAGMSGLAAGIRLAYFEQKVCILERHTTIGGLNSFYRLRHRDYDVGLHAVTNFAPRSAKQSPLGKLLRQLRLDWDDFALCPQRGSKIVFPDVTLRFTNEFELFRSEVEAHFPAQRESFQELLDEIEYDDPFAPDQPVRSAREVLGEFLDDPLLVDMLLCPILYYCSPTPNDVEWRLFVILFRSIFQEGFGRPYDGIRRILRVLVKQFRGNGGELRLRSGATRILHRDGVAYGVELDDGELLEADRILSSAGVVETQRLCDGDPKAIPRGAGDISFMESILTLDAPPAELGIPETAIFFSRQSTFDYRRPETPLDLRSGIICSSNNYEFDEPLAENRLNITALANYRFWMSLDDDVYQREKESWGTRLIDNSVGIVPDIRGRIVDRDLFTPRTIRKFTGHINGAVYGSATKSLDGTTRIKNLYLSGTDQGLPGIVGAMLSGITMANAHCLK